MRVVHPCQELRPLFERSAKRAVEYCLDRKRKGKKSLLQLDLLSVMGFFDAAAWGTMSAPSIIIGPEVVGFVLAQEIHMPRISHGSITTEAYGFIWAAYRHPTRENGEKLTSRVSDLGVEAVVEWSRSRHHHGLLANCSPAMPARVYERYGFKKHHDVIGMEF